MTIHTCQFVNASDLFKGLGKLWDALAESEPDFTWGDNNRSLVTADDILNHLDGCANANLGQLEKLRGRAERIGHQTYVDLES